MSIDQLSSNNNVQTEEQELDEVFDSDKPRPWFPTGDLKNLPTEIYSDSISPAHTTTRDKKGVFGNKLKDVVEEEIARSKLYNDANKEKCRFFISNPPNQPQ
ncbi:hypothetical protein F8M41_013537 [Gigaspora margarita]|uniref:Uncharacterized protein n=1 Tax=Gigaspora margarita TaxID=4874 RepID=A0A8H4ASG9_GIGMA|nr:hypothetical protein F8M41_013537 [Gigaspora margarita]